MMGIGSGHLRTRREKKPRIRGKGETTGGRMEE